MSNEFNAAMKAATVQLDGTCHVCGSADVVGTLQVPTCLDRGYCSEHAPDDRRFETRRADGTRVYLSAQYGTTAARDEAMAAAQQSHEYRTRGWRTVPV